MNKVELLAPAGNIEKSRYAFAYGADAIYIGGGNFSMRALADNFDLEDIRKVIETSHASGKKVYLALNITTKNEQLTDMLEFAKISQNLAIDAFIISDLGVMRKIRKEIKEAKIHVSTQANVTNYDAANMYHELGASRIVLARELSLEEMIEIRKKTDKDLELEVFVHGAMCISYSGRCLLSNFMTGRDSNQGNCAQACRWKYRLVEEKRPGEYYPIYEDDNGSYIFNSKDLSLIKHIDRLIEAGINSFKIEGRMKSIFYVSSVVKVFREAIDKYYYDPKAFVFDPQWEKDLMKTSHREFTDGFIDGWDVNSKTENHTSSSYTREYSYCGIINKIDKDKKMLVVEQRNNFKVGDELEIVSPYSKTQKYLVKEMYDKDFNKIEVAPHPQMKLYLPYEGSMISDHSFLQKKI